MLYIAFIRMPMTAELPFKKLGCPLGAFEGLLQGHFEASGDRSVQGTRAND